MQIKMLADGRGLVTALLGLAAVSGSLGAGEAIQFSSDKIKPAAASQNPLTKDRLSPQSKLSGTSPLDGTGAASMMRNDSRRRLDPKEERRLENKKLEEENWIFVDEGELQAQDDYDEVYGRSDFDSDKKRTSSDIWFATKQGENARQPGATRSRSGALRSPAQNRPQDNGFRDDDKDTSFNFARRLGKESDPKSDRKQAKEPSAQQTTGPDATDSALKDLFGAGSGPVRGFDDRGRGRSELGLRSFDAPGGRDSGLGTSFGLGRAAAGAPLINESAFKPAASAPSLPSLGAGRFGGPGLSDSFSSRGNAGIGPAAPLQTQSQVDSPVRSTRGTFDLPSRPGFGR